MLDMPPLDLDTMGREWLTPFTAQYEAGEWDWDERGSSWYEIEQASGSEAEADSEETRKDK